LSELWYRRYLDHPVHATSQFSLNSAVRQLRMVWQISATQPRTGAVLSPLEKALATYGRTVHIEAGIPESAAEEHLEKVFGDARMMNRLSIQRAIACCRAVGQVRKKGASTGFGTGFAIPGRSLSEKLADDWVFVTNRHVISGNKDNALRPDAASVVFHGGPGEGQPYATEFAQILYEPQNGELDVCVLKFAKFDQAFADTLTAYKIAAAMPCIDANAQAYVVGHPNGGEMMFSLQENKLLDYGLADDWRVHYRAPTQPGSSGSPVFNTDWQLIAIHHAGSKAMPRIYGEGSYEANEGVSMFAIMRLIAQQLH
jgi:V8-like Glu-specific endopeptidase